MYQRITVIIEARHDGRLRIIERREDLLFAEATDGDQLYDCVSVDEAVDVLDAITGTTANWVREYFDRHGAS